MLLKFLFSCLAIWVIAKIIQTIKGYREYHFYKKQGVAFMTPTFNVFSDIQKLMAIIKKYPHAISWYRLYLGEFEADKVPPIIGINFFGSIMLAVTSADLLQDLYVNKNAGITKH